MSRPRFIQVEFGSGISDEDYDKFSEAVMDLADAAMTTANTPMEDCDNDIWVSSGGSRGGTSVTDRTPRQPDVGSFCGRCGHFAGRHGLDGCAFPSDEPCTCRVMQWDGYQWPRPWLPAMEGLRRE